MPLPGSIEAIAELHNKGYQIYVATNQAGLARGLFDENALGAMHAKMTALIEEAGGRLQQIIFCPHHPDDNCPCRKPLPGMLEQIEALANESLVGQPFVGDSMKDLQAAQAMGARPVLVRTGNGTKTEQNLTSAEMHAEVFNDLQSFARSMPTIHPG